MPLGYRSLMYFRVPAQDIFGYVEEQRACWLVHKRLDPAKVVAGAVELGPGCRAELLDRSLDDGTRTSRFTLLERNAAGPWTVRVTTHARAGASPWVLVDVVAPEAPPGTVRPGHQQPATPTFVRLLLDAIDGYDGITRQTSTPSIVRRKDVGAVIDAICDPERRGLVFVAGTPGDFALDSWQTFVNERVKDTVGVATAYVLDHEATLALNTSLEGHGTPPGCFRTYLPDADPASTLDARRHRIMTTRTLLQRPPGYVRRILGGAARAHVVDLPLPADVAAIDRLVAGWETEALLAVPTTPAMTLRSGPRPAPTDEEEIWLILDEAVRTVVGDTAVDAGTVRRVASAAARSRQLDEALDRARSAIDALRGDLEYARTQERQLRTEMDDTELDHALDIERMIELDDQVRHLRGVLMRRGEGEEAWAGVPEAERSRPPDNMSDLLDRLDELPRVKFTGQRDPTLELDNLDTLGRSARKAWLALLALDDYARVRASGAFKGNVHDYCRETPGGCHGWSAERHAADESEATKTNARFAAARELPVPTEVDPARRVFMGAHFKIAAIGSITPRMHYFDDTARSGLVYVGYLGRHLPNAQTN